MEHSEGKVQQYTEHPEGKVQYTEGKGQYIEHPEGKVQYTEGKVQCIEHPEGKFSILNTLKESTYQFTNSHSLQGDAPIQKLKFYSDKDAFFLWAKGNDDKKTYVSVQSAVIVQ